MSEFITGIVKNISLLHLNVLLLLGLALFGGTIGGRLFQRFKIPQVVGYIVIGLAIGQTGIHLIGTDSLKAFDPFNSFALGLIGFMIGGELKLGTLKKYGKQFLAILFMEALTAAVFVGILAAVAGYFLFHNIPLAVSFGLLLGSISAATAAAGTTDVLWEYKARGPLTTTLLGIVALDDIVALVLFAITANICGVLLGRSSGGVGVELAKLGYEVGVAAVLGGLAGFGLAKLLKKFKDEDKTLTFSIGGILFVLGVSVALGVDMILASMLIGVIMTNVAPRRSQEVFSMLERMSSPIFVLFFVLVGAKLDLSQLSLPLIILAAAYLVGRTGGKILGARLGGKMSRALSSVTKYLPLCLFSQSGVAFGLAIIASQRFPNEIGNAVIIIITATTFVVQLAGPPFIKHAVIKANEAGLNVTEEDLLKTSTAGEIVDPALPSIDANMSIKRVLNVFSSHDAFCYPVVDPGKKLVGVLTIETLKETFMAQELSDLLLAHDIMETPPATCGPESTLAEAEEKMRHFRVEYIPVVDGGGAVKGVIEQRGIGKAISRKMIELQERAAALG
ncbi:MAG: cation:proton antiporter [Spirochaetales bacterium]|nr:cation:proton antiporter [Spirochaetales bacterium]